MKRSERALLRKSLAHESGDEELLTSPRVKDNLHLPGFKFPSEDETETDANQRGFFRLLLYVVTRVALEIAEYAAFRITCCLTHWSFCLIFGALPRTIWSGR